MTWRDDVAEADDGSRRPGWEILDGLRTMAFTGAAEFPLTPSATVYLDRGRIYFAERVGDADVADRLVAVGAVRPRDLAAGVIVVGEDHDVDHLGRLFARVPTLDRQRVMLALELLTEATVAWIARQSVPRALTRPYVFHPSGVHQWYDTTPPPSVSPVVVTAAATSSPPPAARPTGDRAHTPADLADVRIEWPELAGLPDDSDAAENPDPEPSAARRWDPAGAPPPTDVDVDADDPAASDHFEVVWPSGDVGAPEPVPESPRPMAVARGDGLDRFDGALDGADLDYPSFPDDDTDSHEVAIAVRRAIAAVESSSSARARQAASPPAPEHRHDTVPADVDGGGAAGSEPVDGHPQGRPSSLTELTDDERRTALKRLIDAMRGR